MTRPEIIRADTIDLQAHDNPSAPRHARPTPDGSLAPHQAETLREVAAEAAEENHRSPPGLWNNDADTDTLYSVSDSQQSGGYGTRHDDAGSMQTGTRQDALAIAQNGGHSGHEVDEAVMDGETEVDVDDDMMDRISSSPSIEDEDIDFEFVYALHTFVATVEGQANATKGDTMVLLDDSNSYWWLVRVVKDSSIGYLPAEHIETPTERLARLNKHRNIDLSATMLGDQTDKVRNPIRSAIKRKKAKTVQFAPPTFVDYSDIDYSSEEEDVAAEYFAQAAQQGQKTQQASAAADTEDDSAKVEPLKPRTTQKDSKPDETDNSAKPRSSEEGGELKVDGPKKTSDGTVRDSFFKDDTVETKKITLTPNLLRDDDGTRLSSESKEMRQRPSLDRLLDKDGLLGKDGKKGKDKKEKDKKPSAIRSFFSRKDKDKKASHEDEDLSRDSHEREPEEEEVSQGSPEKTGPQRQPSKLQKQQPRTEPSPTRKPGSTRETGNGVDIKAFLSESKVNNVANVPPATMRLVEASPKGSPQGSPQTSGRPQKATKAKTRMGLDDFDSDDDDLDPQPVQSPPSQDPRRQQPQQQKRAAPNNTNPFITQQQAQPASLGGQAVRGAPTLNSPPQQHEERLSESPVQVSPVMSSNPPPLMVDTSSQEEDRSSPRSTPSPELIEHEDADTSVNKETITPSTSSRSSWNDTNLRAFFDSGSDIRDLLVVVYDKSNVDPVSSDHPVANGLFREQNAKLAEITTQLDNMLGDWLARKQRLRGTV
ncbi:protein phosphatase regulator [Podospora pseudocomata]|uniref:Protein phosphatase regulator n=1 Tax=Podospora pseudocomata TaxID=2093779 RepID=A0ABR0G3J3_9PEZI|nr:protein phosphatase regulator [Podospora pseudocomata]